MSIWPFHFLILQPKKLLICKNTEETLGSSGSQERDLYSPYLGGRGKPFQSNVKPPVGVVGLHLGHLPCSDPGFSEGIIVVVSLFNHNLCLQCFPP